ncbi:MAG: mannosyltransferase family protein [Verrucomicrobia bacterium]|nr:mannosyltransferase family protein [Verrucomicrobiota bacterium]
MAEYRTQLRGLLSRFDRTVLGYLLLFKLCFFFLAVLSIELLPVFRMEVFDRLMSWPREGEPTWESHFATWDGAHYLSISKDGYIPGSESCAFYPLWPFLIRTCSFLFFEQHFWAGIVLANLLSLGGLLLFHRLVVDLEGIEIANWSVILLLAFPGAIFLSLIYTEPLFFLLSILFFLLLFRQRFWLAAVIAFFLPLTKAIGVFAIVPLAWQLWLRRPPRKTYLCLAGPCLGYLCYFLTMRIWTGNAFEGFEAQSVASVTVCDARGGGRLVFAAKDSRRRNSFQPRRPFGRSLISSGLPKPSCPSRPCIAPPAP